MKKREGEALPGVHLSVGGPDLAGAAVFGGGARGRAAAAPGAAARAQVHLALGLFALPSRHVRAPPRRGRRTSVVCLRPTRAMAALGGVAFCPGLKEV